MRPRTRRRGGPAGGPEHAAHRRRYIDRTRDGRCACPGARARPLARAPAPGNDVHSRGARTGGRADTAPVARLGRHRRPELVPDVRRARRALPGHRSPTCAGTDTAFARGASSASPTAPTTARPRWSSSAPARSSPWAIRWAARSRSCSGSAIAISSRAWCCARPRPGSFRVGARAFRINRRCWRPSARRASPACLV